MHIDAAARSTIDLDRLDFPKEMVKLKAPEIKAAVKSSVLFGSQVHWITIFSNLDVE